MPRPKKTAAELEAGREQILDTALAILQEDGPEAISSRAIAERIGVAHMSLYTYFPNQEAILSALSEREIARHQSQLLAIEQRAGQEDLLQVMSDLLRYFITFAQHHPNLYRLAWVMPEKIGESAERTRLRMQSTVEIMARLIDQGIKDGVFTPREPHLAAATVLGMVNMPYILFHSGKLIDPGLRDRMVDEVLGAAMLYLTVRSPVL